MLPKDLTFLYSSEAIQQGLVSAPSQKDWIAKEKL